MDTTVATPARSGNRTREQLRPIRILRGVLKHPAGSSLIEWGDTRVLCSATVEEKIPPFLMGHQPPQGWVTAEYAMLPGATNTRTQRERNRVAGRTHEIQRLIGRSLRAVTDMTALGHRTVTIDCDVLQADGGTRTAAITGGYIALYDACRKLVQAGLLPAIPLREKVAAVSVGVIGGVCMLDLDYQEDSQADVDMNFVITGSGHFVEVQGTAEQHPFSLAELTTMCEFAQEGAKHLFAVQQEAIDALPALHALGARQPE